MTSAEFSNHYHEKVFRLACHERKGAEFQRFFKAIMLKHAPSFTPVKPHRREGDWKCDGWIPHSGTLFRRFLIHDSTLFDGADERQFTQALHLAHLASHNENFQYLCCLNSDRIPITGFPAGFDWRAFIKLTLQDGPPDGGLFGFRFGEGVDRSETEG